MKKIIYLLVIIFISSGVHAQIANTKWAVTLQLDDAVDVLFNFETDTLEVISADDNSSLETMRYSTTDTVLTLQKLYGQSQCDTAAIGKYSFTVNGNELWLKLISDDCTDRAGVIKDIKLEKKE